MSKRKPRTPEDVLNWAKEQSEKVSAKDKPLEDKQLWAWQLRRRGYTVEQTAQILSIGTTTVKRWDKAVDEKMSEMPAIRLAIDAFQAKVPKALSVYDKALNSDDIRVAKDAAKDILTTFHVAIDRKEIDVKDDRKQPDNDLVAEAERILAIAGSKGSAGTDNDRTETA
jgi:hypothetical protein